MDGIKDTRKGTGLKERATNFKEVCLGYNQEEAQEEASRCINWGMQNVSRDARLPSIYQSSLQK